jgi:hypothetical protein
VILQSMWNQGVGQYMGRVLLGQEHVGGTGWPGVKQPPSLEFFPDAKRVYEMVRATARGRLQSPSPSTPSGP